MIKHQLYRSTNLHKNATWHPGKLLQSIRTHTTVPERGPPTLRSSHYGLLSKLASMETSARGFFILCISSMLLSSSSSMALATRRKKGKDGVVVGAC